MLTVSLASMRLLSWYVLGMEWGWAQVGPVMCLGVADRVVCLGVVQENWEMSNGPLSLLQTAVRSHSQVLISIRSNRKL